MLGRVRCGPVVCGVFLFFLVACDSHACMCISDFFEYAPRAVCLPESGHIPLFGRLASYLHHLAAFTALLSDAPPVQSTNATHGFNLYWYTFVTARSAVTRDGCVSN